MAKVIPPFLVTPPSPPIAEDQTTAGTSAAASDASTTDTSAKVIPPFLITPPSPPVTEDQAAAGTTAAGSDTNITDPSVTDLSELFFYSRGAEGNIVVYRVNLAEGSFDLVSPTPVIPHRVQRAMGYGTNHEPLGAAITPSGQCRLKRSDIYPGSGHRRQRLFNGY